MIKTIEEMENAIEEIEKKARKEKSNIYCEYARSHNHYKIGNIISYNDTIIIIEKMSVSKMFTRTPKMNYIGRKLKKNLEPFKSGQTDSIYQNDNIIKLNKEKL